MAVSSVPYVQVYRARGVRNPDPFRPEAAQNPLSQLVAHGELVGGLRHTEVGRGPHLPLPAPPPSRPPNPRFLSSLRTENWLVNSVTWKLAVNPIPTSPNPM